MKHKKVSYPLYALLIIIFFLPGCATITRSDYERYIIESDPPGAKATLSSGETCITPCNLLKKRKDSFSVHIEKEGYVSMDVDVDHKVAGAGVAGFLGNGLIGGIIGCGVDMHSGATLKLEPNPTNVKLEPITEAKTLKPRGIDKYFIASHKCSKFTLVYK